MSEPELLVKQTPEYENIQNEIMDCFKSGDIWKAKDICNNPSLPDEIVHTLVKKGVLYGLESGNIGIIFEIKQRFHFSEDIIYSPEVQAAAHGAMMRCFENKDIHYARHLKRSFKLVGENNYSPEIQASIQEGIISYLKTGKMDDALKTMKEFGLPDKIIHSPEIQAAAKEGVLYCFKNNEIYIALEIKKEFDLSNEIIHSPEVQTAAQQAMIYCFERDKIENALIFRDEFSLSEEVVQVAAREGIIRVLQRGGSYGVIDIKEKLNLPEEIVQAAIQEGIIYLINNVRIDAVGHILQVFHLFSEDFIHSPEVQTAAQRAMIYCFKAGDINEVLKIRNTFNLSEEMVQDAAQEGMITLFGRGDIKKVLEIKKRFNLPEKMVQVAAKADILTRLKHGQIGEALEIKEEYNLSEEVFYSPEAKAAAQEGIIHKLEYGQIRDALEIKNTAHLSEDIFSSPEAQIAIEKGMIYCFEEGKIKDVLEIKEMFHLPEEMVQSAAKKGMIVCLERGRMGDALEIKNTVNFSEEIIGSSDVQIAIQKGVTERLEDGAIYEALLLKDEFNLSETIIAEIDKKFATNLQNTKLIRFILCLGDENVTRLFPVTLLKVKEMIFVKLVQDQDLADYFIENLDKYHQQSWAEENVIKAIKHYPVAQKFVHALENDQPIWKNDAWVTDIFTQAKTVIEEHKKKFDNTVNDDRLDYRGEGLRDTDPYENHPWLFGGQQIRTTSILSGFMIGKLNIQELEKLGMNGKEIVSALTEANRKVDGAYQSFLEQIRSNQNIKEEDKQAFLNPESSTIKMTPLFNNIRSFIARYFVQSVQGDVARLSEIGNLNNGLDRILKEGFKKYIKILEVDIPLYDKLYEEFDELRKTGRSPLEVYLGRDGIYAYVGRRSQDVARRRKLGFKERKRLKETGEVIEIHPQYVVYPRYFRDNLSRAVKRQFLDQEGINRDTDPLFYDTGYTGTIPEQIMRVMGFETKDIEQRIRLLSAPYAHRRVKGISENARHAVIEYIEGNAKTEGTAEGLIVDEKTGKIRHIAEPTNPEEQFYFMMIKQALERHYWLQEQLHHKSSKNVDIAMAA